MQCTCVKDEIIYTVL